MPKDDTIEDDLYNMGLIDGDDLVSTDDGFSMTLTSLSDLFTQRGITTIPISENYDLRDTEKYLDQSGGMAKGCFL